MYDGPALQTTNNDKESKPNYMYVEYVPSSGFRVFIGIYSKCVCGIGFIFSVHQFATHQRML